MSLKLYRIDNREALESLRASNARILWRFGEVVVLRGALGHKISGVSELDPTQLRTSGSLRIDKLGERAFALRSSPEWHIRKAARPNVGMRMDQVIAGTAETSP